MLTNRLLKLSLLRKAYAGKPLYTVIPRKNHSSTGAMNETNTSDILVDGQRIQYVTRGNGEHPVLLLPGALGTSPTDFSPQIKELGDNPNPVSYTHLRAHEPPEHLV